MVKVPHYFSDLKLPHVSRKQWFIASGALASLFCAFGLWTIFAPQTLAYNYGLDTTCATSPRLLPGLSKLRSSATFRMFRPASFSIGKVVLYAHRICTQPQAAPKAKVSYMHTEQLFGSKRLARQITVATAQYPHLTRPVAKKTMRPGGMLSLDLTAADKTFTYALATESTLSLCDSVRAKLRCDLTELGLGYAQTYELSLVRIYQGKRLATITTIPVLTITPTTVTTTSIAAGSTVQDKPNSASHRQAT